MLELDANHWATVQQVLAHRIPGATVIAFGSRVRGWPYGQGCKPYSDLDLAIEAVAQDAHSLALALAEMRADFDDSSLPWRVDVSLLDDLPIALQQRVIQSGYRWRSPVSAGLIAPDA
jgi:predicted nucleotidyltransferase